MANPRGSFIPTFISNVDDEATQAKKILDQVKAYKEAGCEEVGITCMVDNSQAESIVQITQGKGWKTEIKTLPKLNQKQVPVMQKVEELLETPQYQSLQGVFRILPITTKKDNEGNFSHGWVTRDLDNINAFLQKPKHVVLGWQDEKSKQDKKLLYAVRGDIADINIPGTDKTEATFIGEQLKAFAEQYYPSDDLKKVTTQNKKEDAQEAQQPPQTPIRVKGKLLGMFGGSLLGLLLGSIPIWMIFFGIILVPISLGGTLILTFLGLLMFGTGFLGAWKGYQFGKMIDNMPITPPPLPGQQPENPNNPNSPAYMQQRLKESKQGKSGQNLIRQDDPPQELTVGSDFESDDDDPAPLAAQRKHPKERKSPYPREMWTASDQSDQDELNSDLGSSVDNFSVKSDGSSSGFFAKPKAVLQRLWHKGLWHKVTETFKPGGKNSP